MQSGTTSMPCTIVHQRPHSTTDTRGLNILVQQRSTFTHILHAAIHSFHSHMCPANVLCSCETVLVVHCLHLCLPSRGSRMLMPAK